MKTRRYVGIPQNGESTRNILLNESVYVQIEPAIHSSELLFTEVQSQYLCRVNMAHVLKSGQLMSIKVNDG